MTDVRLRRARSLPIGRPDQEEVAFAGANWPVWLVMTMPTNRQRLLILKVIQSLIMMTLTLNERGICYEPLKKSKTRNR
jgi:hypothetical protein